MTIALRIAFVLAALLAGFWLLRPAAPPARAPLAPRVGIELAAPDVLISSTRLSALPADLLQLPLLRELLSEDFVFYYQHNDARVSLEGSLRRIAFEHELKLADRLLAHLLDEPAELALWRGPNGALRYWVLSIHRNLLGRLAEPLAHIALDDAQLSLAGELEVEGTPAKVYRLALDARRSLLFASAGERLVVLSDPALLLAANASADEPAAGADTPVAAPFDARRAAVVSALLAGAPGEALLAGSFRLDGRPFAGHRIAARGDFLSFGYQAFFPAIEALRADFNGRSWSSQLLADDAALGDAAPLWQHLPSAPAACLVLPVNWPALVPLLREGLPGVGTGALPAALDGPLAACWYGAAKLATPLFAARFSSAEAAREATPALAAMFEAAVGAHEDKHPEGRFAVETQQNEGVTRWQRTVSSPYGSEEARSAPDPKALAAPRYFPVSLAQADEWLYFSPDATLVEQALAVAGQRYPAAGDGRPEASRTLLALTPASLAELFRKDTLAALPREHEPIFGQVARERLLPRLEALAGQPPLIASWRPAPGSGLRWHPLVWQAGR